LSGVRQGSESARVVVERSCQGYVEVAVAVAEERGGVAGLKTLSVHSASVVTQSRPIIPRRSPQAYVLVECGGDLLHLERGGILVPFQQFGR
jgi:hypothetical protein